MSSSQPRRSSPPVRSPIPPPRSSPPPKAARAPCRTTSDRATIRFPTSRPKAAALKPIDAAAQGLGQLAYQQIGGDAITAKADLGAPLEMKVNVLSTDVI